MFYRIQAAMFSAFQRVDKRIQALSPTGKKILILIIIALIMLAQHFGWLPSRHMHSAYTH